LFGIHFAETFVALHFYGIVVFAAAGEFQLGIFAFLVVPAVALVFAFFTR
jgi:hypothetical protein